MFPRALIEASTDDTLGEVPSSLLPAFAFVDLSRRRDLTTIATVLRDGPRRPEALDHLVVASLQVFDPKAMPSGEIDFELVRAALAQLPERFPHLSALAVDEGAESGSVLPWARAIRGCRCSFSGFTATVAENMRFVERVECSAPRAHLSLPPHERLLDGSRICARRPSLCTPLAPR